MKRIIWSLVVLFCIIVMSDGQVIMKVFQKDGTTGQYLVDDVDSISFVDITPRDTLFPSITTDSIYSITSFWATVGATITSDGGAIVSSRGLCWSTDTAPTMNSSTKYINKLGIGSFSCSITGLQPSTTYFVRAFATNGKGTSYGSKKSFTTQSSSGTVTDIDGNIYQTIKIGTQTWMAENLKTTKYRDGSSIPNITDAKQWADMNSGAYCDYNNNVNNSDIYGRHYNWFAATDKRNIAPIGWHVPTEEEWSTLISFLGGYEYAGGKLKETSTAHWEKTNVGATNETGFSALPGGSRYSNGDYNEIGTSGSYWNVSEYSIEKGWTRAMVQSAGIVIRTIGDKKMGISIRCIKD